jgi:hypothetical protein
MFMGFGLFMFVFVGRAQARYEGKMQQIQAGNVKPEQLTTVRKYANGNITHIVLTGAGENQVDLVVPNKSYNSTPLGKAVDGYHFTDGYLVPAFRDERADRWGRWLFLSFGLGIGLIVWYSPGRFGGSHSGAVPI